MSKQERAKITNTFKKELLRKLRQNFVMDRCRDKQEVDVKFDKNNSYHIACLTMSVQKFQSFIKTSCLGNRDKYLSWTFARINVCMSDSY